MTLFICGCGGNLSLSTISPEDGSATNNQVTFSGTQIDVVLNYYVIQGQPATIIVIPYDKSANPDSTNVYTYTFNTDDVFADLPNGAAKAGASNSNQLPTTSDSQVLGTATYPNAQFHSIPKHSPLVHLTVSGKTTESDGTVNNIGPVTASSRIWYFNAPPGNDDRIDVLASNANDFVFSTTGLTNYCSLPNPIVDTTGKPIPNLNIKVFNGLHTTSGTIVAIGPWNGGMDPNLPCFSTFGGVCDNYWNRDKKSCEDVALNFCNVPNNTFSCIGLSQGVWADLDEDNAIQNHPKDIKGDQVNGNVDWRFKLNNE